MWQTDWQTWKTTWLAMCDRHEKKMRGGILSKNIWEGGSERRNENIIVSGTLKNIDNQILNLFVSMKL